MRAAPGGEGTPSSFGFPSTSLRSWQDGGSPRCEMSNIFPETETAETDEVSSDKNKRKRWRTDSCKLQVQQLSAQQDLSNQTPDGSAKPPRLSQRPALISPPPPARGERIETCSSFSREAMTLLMPPSQHPTSTLEAQHLTHTPPFAPKLPITRKPGSHSPEFRAWRSSRSPDECTWDGAAA